MDRSTGRALNDPVIADRRAFLTLARWADHLRQLGATASPPEWPPDSAVRPARSGPRGPGGEVDLWRSLRETGHLGSSIIDLDASGPLWPSSEWAAIEVWTEAELCGLHGLWRALRLGGGEDAALRQRLAAAVRWHLEYTQPDNATNRPWAVHVFLLHGLEGAADVGVEVNADARLYAETLVHNAQAQGNADPASRWILADAARELELVLGHLGA